jgi:dUTP pyrophosphatase
MSMNWHDRWFPNYKLNFERSLGLSVKFRKLVPEAVTPEYAQNGDAGLDLTATSFRRTETFMEYGTGIAVEIPNGHVGLLFPRSSITKAPSGVSLKNSVGVIDSNYRGEILARFEYPSFPFDDEWINNVPKVGDKIAQLLIVPYPKVYFEEVSKLSDTNRGDGGFGSTDKK